MTHSILHFNPKNWEQEEMEWKHLVCHFDACHILQNETNYKSALLSTVIHQLMIRIYALYKN